MSTSLRALVLEDSSDDVLLLIHQLEKGGYNVEYTRVESGRDMERKLEEDWEIILSDYNMPQFDALAALEIYHRHKMDIPFIVISGAVGEEMAVDLMKAGAHDFVRKDNTTRLLPAIERELKEHQIRQSKSRAEQALRRSEEKYRALVDSSPDAIMSVSPDEKILSYNAAAVQLWQYPAREIIGKTLSECGLFSQDSMDELHREVKKMVEGETRPPFELITLTRDKKTIFAEAHGRLMENFNSPSALQLTLRNVSRRKKLEDQLLQTQKMEAFGQLASGIVHDFNNQLAGIIGYAELIKRRLLKNHPLQDYIDEILSTTERAADLTNQLMSFSRKSQLRKISVDIHSILWEVIQILRHTLDPKIDIHTEFQSSNSTIQGDPNQIQNALLNLAVNARDAMPNGGRLSFSTNVVNWENRIPEHLPQNLHLGQYLHIQVGDTGMGMDENNMEKIFEPFFTTKDKGKGTGLGLATVLNTVQNHYGAIEVESQISAGSTFHLYFPLAESTSEVPPTPLEEKLIRGRGHILVVDDEESFLKLSQQLLTDLGYEVTISRDGLEAVSLYHIHRDSIDLVILDLVMPKLDGQDTMAALRELDEEVKILIASGHSMEAEAKMALEDQVLGFIPKPFRHTSLSRAVAKALGNQY